MYRLRTLVRRIRALFQNGRLDAVLDEELRFHLEMEADRLVQERHDARGGAACWPAATSAASSR